MCQRGGMLFAVSVIPGNSLAVLLFYLADGHLSGFSQLSSLHLAFFLSLRFFKAFLCSADTVDISKGIQGSWNAKPQSVLCFSLLSLSLGFP